MGQNFQDSKRYASVFASPSGPGDARPTGLQILKDNDVIDKLTDKTVLVTGGSSGLGVDEVKNLARSGARVFFTARDLAKGKATRDEMLKELKSEGLVKEPRIEVIEMDLESIESVRKAAEEFKAKSKQLNILVNNAAAANMPTLQLVEGYEAQFRVNHLAHFFLFYQLKDLLLQSTTPSFHSRVVAVSSLAHTMAPMETGDYNFEKRGYSPFAAYAQSKTANIWFASELERKYGSQGLHATSVHPGGITDTGLGRHMDEESKAAMRGWLEMPHIARSLMSIEQGTSTVVLAAVGKEYEGVGGFYMEDCGVSQAIEEDAPLGAPGYKPWAYNEAGEKQLWLDSLNILGLKDE